MQWQDHQFKFEISEVEVEFSWSYIARAVLPA